MPVKAKRSTYNYSLPITVKKTRTCLGPLWATGPRTHAEGDARLGCGRESSSPRDHPGHCWPAHPAEGMGRALGETSRVARHCPVRTASQLVSMHDLKQGLGPPGTAGARKAASNKYKLKVGVPESPGSSRPPG